MKSKRCLSQCCAFDDPRASASIHFSPHDVVQAFRVNIVRAQREETLGRNWNKISEHMSPFIVL